MEKRIGRKRRPSCPVIPYRRALKAYAFAGKDLDYALDQLRILDFEVPRSDSIDHRVIMDSYKSRYRRYQKEARAVSLTYSLTPLQAAYHRVDPMYSWIVSDEDASSSDEALFVDGVIREIRDFFTRRLMCVMIRLGHPPEEIANVIEGVTGRTFWTGPEILFFNEFFWSVDEMMYEDWMCYLAIMNPYQVETVDEKGLTWPGNPHASYLKDMAAIEWLEPLKVRCMIPLSVDLESAAEETKTVATVFAMEALRKGDLKAAAELSRIFQRFSVGQKPRGEGGPEYDEIFETLKIISTPTQARRHGIDLHKVGVPAIESASPAMGDISDPNDISASLEE